MINKGEKDDQHTHSIAEATMPFFVLYDDGSPISGRSKTQLQSHEL